MALSLSYEPVKPIGKLGKGKGHRASLYPRVKV
jgi:hypothetical protein